MIKLKLGDLVRSVVRTLAKETKVYI